MIIWRLMDGKPGHETQSAGLLQSVARRTPLQVFEIPCLATHSVVQRLETVAREGRRLPLPDMIVGAGHATHLALILARHWFGGRSLVLMRPSLPVQCFDLVLVPEHDGMKESSRVITTKGMLNKIRPAMPRQGEGRGTMLIGGPSKAFHWKEDRILSQIETILAGQEIEWKLTTSRRTPATTLRHLRGLERERACLTVVPAEETHTGWVADHLRASQHVCVSADSMSMIFEALTSGAVTTILDVPTRSPKHRLVRAVANLRDEGFIADAAHWNRAGDDWGLRSFPCEADRCAGLVLEKMLSWIPVAESTDLPDPIHTMA